MKINRDYAHTLSYSTIQWEPWLQHFLVMSFSGNALQPLSVLVFPFVHFLDGLSIYYFYFKYNLFIVSLHNFKIMATFYNCFSVSENLTIGFYKLLGSYPYTSLPLRQNHKVKGLKLSEIFKS